MGYTEMGVPCTKSGYPICYLDWQSCDIEGCRYHANIPSIGNCVLRIDKHQCFTLEAIGDAMGLTRERIRQIEERMLRRLSARPELREMLTDLQRSEQR